MPVLAGHPETAAHLCLTTIFFAVALRVFSKKNDESRDGFIRRMVIAGCLAFGVAAIQILPTVEWIGQILHDLYYTWPALPARQALGFFSRDIQHGPNSAGILIPEAASYMGMMTLLAAPLAALHPNKRCVVALTIISLVAIGAAFGVQPIYWVIAHLPLFKAIKNSRLILVATFGLAALAGLGISTLQDQARLIKRRTAAIMLVCTAFVLGIAFIYTLQRSTEFRVSVMGRPSFSRVLLMASAIPLIAAITGRLRGRAFSAAICGIAAFDLLTFSYGFTSFAQREDIFPPAPLFDFIKTQLDSNQFRIAALSGSYPVNSPVAYGIAAADGYDIPLHRTWAFTDGLRADDDTALQFTEDALLEAQDRRLDLLNVKYLVGSKVNPDFPRINRDPRFTTAFETSNLAVFENKQVLPRAFAVPLSEIELIPDSEAQLNRLKDHSFDPERSVILSTKPVAPAISDAPLEPFTSRVVVLSNDNHSQVYRIETSQASMLVISQTYYPGWKATIDGNEAEVIPADLALTGVVVPAGTHNIRLVFSPFSFRAGATLSLIAVITVGGLLLSAQVSQLERRVLRPAALTTGVAALAAAIAITSSNQSLSGSDGAYNIPRRHQIDLQFSGNMQLVTSAAVRLQTGYARFENDSSDITGVALLRYRQGRVQSEIVVPPSPPTSAGTIPFRLDNQYRTALIIVNGGSAPTTIDASADTDSTPRHFIIPARDKLTVNLDEAPLHIKAADGTLTWRSSVAVSVAAVQTFHDASHSFLMAPIPVGTSISLTKSRLYLPYWSSTPRFAQLILVNPTDDVLTGYHASHTTTGAAISKQSYSIPPHSASRVVVKNAERGWMEVVPDHNQVAPGATLILSPTENETSSLVTIEGMPAIETGTIHTVASQSAPIRAMLVNPHETSVRLTLPREMTLPPFRAVVDEIMSSGTFQVRSDSPIALALFRTRFVSGTADVTSSYPTLLSHASLFPHFATGGLFTTEFHLFGPEKRVVQNVLDFFDDGGHPTEVALKVR
jgi:hypothetical protein